MSYSVNKTTITLTRGDTFKAYIKIYDEEGNDYIPKEGDSIRFAMKGAYTDKAPIVVKTIPISTMLLKLDSDDTKDLSFGSYVYDIQLTTADGDVNTFITKAQIVLTEEVD